MKEVIAIDGPAGAGKSSLARGLAQQMNYRYLDTGAMYRAITWLALKNNIDLEKKQKIVELAQTADLKLLSKKGNINSCISINDYQLDKELRTQAVDKNVSRVAKIRGVREALVEKQRELATTGNIIMDGRDIGSHVLPDADYKFFITATLEERARRRLKDIRQQKPEANLEEVKEEIAERDKIDTQRQVSPLQKAEDAVLIDTTNMSLQEVIAYVRGIIQKGEKTHEK